MNVRTIAPVILLGLLSVTFGCARNADEIRRDYQRAKAARTADWLERAYDLAGEWAVAYLSDHTDAEDEALTKWMAQLDPPSGDAGNSIRSAPVTEGGCGVCDLVTSAVRISRGLYVVAAGFTNDDYPQYGVGTFFLISRAGGKYQIAWTAAGSKDKRVDGLVEDITKLPPSAKGHPRFYLQNSDLQGSGCWLQGQLSVWEWDGTRAIPLLIRHYTSNFDLSGGDGPIKFDGQFIRVRTKESFKAFMDYSCSRDPEGEWTIRITPEEVMDLGVRRVHPELDLIDDLFDRINRRRNAEQLAAPTVISALQKTYPNGLAPVVPDWKLQGAELCVNLNMGEPVSHIFTLSRAGGTLFVTSVKDVSRACNSE